MDRIQSLKIFAAVAEAESFAGGARKVGLSAPSVTRGINALETSLGVRLFTRTTRSVQLTDVGRTYLEDARHILAQLQAADDAARGAATNPKGKLHITCPNEFGRIYVSPITTEFLDLYPSVSASVLMLDRVVNIVEEGFDIAVRIGELPSSGLTAVRVGQVRRVVCGSPEYFSKNGAPQKPSDLKSHQVIAVSTSTRRVEWRFGRDMQDSVTLKPRLTTNSIAAALSIARNHWGVCRVLSYQIGPDLQEGHLKTVLNDYEPAPLPIHLVHVEGRRAPAKVRAFIELAKERLKSTSVLN